MRENRKGKILWNPENSTLFCVGLLLIGLIFSPFLLSVSMWGLVGTAFWQAVRQLPPGQVASPQNLLRVTFQIFFRQGPLLLLSLLLLVTAVSGLWSDDLAYWLERTRVRIPFFVLPFAFANLPKLDERAYKGVLYFLVWVLTLTCVGVGLNYWIHYEEVMQALHDGRSVPVPRGHIRFNLILVTGVLCGLYLALQKFRFRFAWETRALWAATIFMFVFVHVLSVRSGLAAMYAALLFLLLRFVWQSRRWGLGAAALCLLALMPMAAMRVFPSLAQKIAYMRWDWGQYQQAQGATYSDSERWISMQAGWRLFREQPILGVGTGDLPKTMQVRVEQDFPHYKAEVKLPHNQFLYILTATGLWGLLFSLPALLGLLWVAGNRRFWLFLGFQVIAFVSFLVEYTLETSIGAAFYLFFSLFFAFAPPEARESGRSV